MLDCVKIVNGGVLGNVGIAGGIHTRAVDAANRSANRQVSQDTRRGYGEDRLELLGRIADRLFAVVYTPRAGALRSISARKANARERQFYDHHSQED